MRHRRNLPAHQVHRQFNGFLAAVIEIDMRVLMAVEQHGGVIQHGRRQVAVQIERHHQRHLRANHVAHIGEERPLDVVTPLR